MNFLIFIVWMYNSASAAVPQQKLDETIIYSLREPHRSAVQSLKNIGPQGLKRLKEIAFDERMPMKTRWNSFMALTQIEGVKSIGNIQQALSHETWFMRSAGLTALHNINTAKAKQWATRILKTDRALLVRMKAIEVLSDAKDESTTELFWEKLHANDSFHLNKSLWIREDITKLLLRNPRKKDLKRWVHLLHDKEEKFQSMAAVALTKIAKVEEQPTEQDLSYWQKRYPASPSVVR